MKSMQLSIISSPFDGTQLCLQYPTDIFYPEADDLGNYNESDFDTAKNICSSCWLKDKCLEFALKTNEKEGVWGGTTPKERRSIRRKARR